MRKSIPFSNWQTMIEGLSYTPSDFFTQLKDNIDAKEIKDLKTTVITMKEGGLFSAKRQYLRITRQKLCFDICGAPYGNGFFVSWWLGDMPSAIKAFFLRLPLIGWLLGILAEILRPETYFTNDTRSMFQSLIHSAVTKSVDDIMESGGLRQLTLEEKKPVMKSFFEKK